MAFRSYWPLVSEHNDVDYDYKNMGVAMTLNLSRAKVGGLMLLYLENLTKRLTKKHVAVLKQRNHNHTA